MLAGAARFFFEKTFFVARERKTAGGVLARPRGVPENVAVTVRKTARCVHGYPCEMKVIEINRRAASPASRRRAEANLGAPRPAKKKKHVFAWRAVCNIH